MSLRYASRVLYQAGNRVVQGMKDQISRCDSTVKISLRDSSSKQSRVFSGGAADSTSAFKAAKKDRHNHKQAEESLRTVMYLSCWGPN